MILTQKPASKRTVGKEGNKSVVRGTGQIDSRSPVESVLRDLAFVLHATRVVRQKMVTEQALCSVTL